MPPAYRFRSVSFIDFVPVDDGVEEDGDEDVSEEDDDEGDDDDEEDDDEEIVGKFVRSGSSVYFVS
jgi:hypothetical protein